jgi:hypothetical protein
MPSVPNPTLRFKYNPHVYNIPTDEKVLINHTSGEVKSSPSAYILKVY